MGDRQIRLIWAVAGLPQLDLAGVHIGGYRAMAVTSGVITLRDWRSKE